MFGLKDMNCSQNECQEMDEAEDQAEFGDVGGQDGEVRSYHWHIRWILEADCLVLVRMRRTEAVRQL